MAGRQPRWPKGTPVRPDGGGPGGGRFRGDTDLPAGVPTSADWADRLAARATGRAVVNQRRPCPVCGRMVSTINAGNKIAPHNPWNAATNRPIPGVRCSGSGAAFDEQGEFTLRGDQQAPARARRAPTQAGPAPLPEIPLNARALDPIPNDHPAKIQMMRWRRSASGGSGNTDAQDEYQRWLYQYHQKVDQVRHKKRMLEIARENQRWYVQRDLSEQWRRENPGGDYYPPPGWRESRESAALDAHPVVTRARQELFDAETALAGVGQAPDDPFDPANPLAAYGRMLHIDGGDTWHTYQALKTLQETTPPEYHQLMVRHMAEQSGGVWIGDTQKMHELDSLADLRGQRPRGWGRNDTYADVDGLVRHGAVLVVTHTPNTESHRNSREATRRRTMGLTATEALRLPPIDATATAHEFGHTLDAAIGYLAGGGTVQDASQQRLWRLLYNRVKGNAGRSLSPYFRQTGEAGPSELWADAFGLWAQVPPAPVDLDTHNFTLLRHYWPGQRTNRPVTLRDLALAETYGIRDTRIAQDLSDYFDRMYREVQSGRRVPAREQVRRATVAA